MAAWHNPWKSRVGRPGAGGGLRRLQLLPSIHYELAKARWYVPNSPIGLSLLTSVGYLLCLPFFGLILSVGSIGGLNLIALLEGPFFTSLLVLHNNILSYGSLIMVSERTHLYLGNLGFRNIASSNGVAFCSSLGSFTACFNLRSTPGSAACISRALMCCLQTLLPGKQPR